MSDLSTRRIPLRELDVMLDLIEAHQEIHSEKLYAVIAFGDILSDDYSYDIDLLEVVKDWEGPRSATFASSEQLPLRGTLRLYFLKPEEFEDPNSIQEEMLRNWTKTLLKTVQQAHDILFSRTPKYVENSLSLSKALAFDRPPDFNKPTIKDPFKLLSDSFAKQGKKVEDNVLR